MCIHTLAYVHIRAHAHIHTHARTRTHRQRETERARDRHFIVAPTFLPDSPESAEAANDMTDATGLGPPCKFLTIDTRKTRRTKKKQIGQKTKRIQQQRSFFSFVFFGVSGDRGGGESTEHVVAMIVPASIYTCNEAAGFRTFNLAEIATQAHA